MFICLIYNFRHINTNTYVCICNMHFPTFTSLGASFVAQLVKKLTAMQEIWIRFQGREDLLEKEMATHTSVLAWGIHGHDRATKPPTFTRLFFSPENFPQFSCAWFVNNLSSSTGIYILRGKNDTESSLKKLN